MPSDVGSVFPGKSGAPATLKSAGLVSQLENAGYVVNLRNALPDGNIGWTESSLGPNGARNEAAAVAVAVCHSVKQTIINSLNDQNSEFAFPFQLALGGECLLPRNYVGILPSLPL